MKKFISCILILVLAVSTVCYADDTWTCPTCGREGLTGKFCGTCGTSRPEESWTCPMCGRVGNTEQYCPRCGSSREQDEVTNDPVVPADASLQIGQAYIMGSYRGYEITWRVLDVENNRALLISENVLEAKEFDKVENGAKNTWFNSALNTWLNGEFYNTAFSNSEKSRVIAGQNSERVFLLSVSEATRYSSSLISYPMSYLAGQVGTGEKGSAWYWLRDGGIDRSRTCFVKSTGEISINGELCTNQRGGVRPAVWIELN